MRGSSDEGQSSQVNGPNWGSKGYAKVHHGWISKVCYPVINSYYRKRKDWECKTNSNSQKMRRLEAGKSRFECIEVSWRSENILLPILDEGECGACYAFAATEACSALYRKETGKSIQLSTQYIVDYLPILFQTARPPADKTGAYPARLDEAFQLIKEHGVCREVDYPYKACRTGDCSMMDAETEWFSIKDFHYLRNEVKILRQLKIQPLAGSIHAYDSFKSHKEGVYMGPEPHERANSLQFILVVAYGEVQGIKYYEIKNSWGAMWGDRGYAKVRRDLIFGLWYPLGCHKLIIN